MPVNPTDRIPLVLVGAGRAAERLYGPALRKSKSFRVVAIVDPAQGRRTWAERYFSTGTYEGLEQWLREREPIPNAAALVAVPPRAQYATVKAALEAGLAVLAEKPLVSGVAEAETLLQIAGRSSLRLALSRHYWPRYKRLRESLEAVAFRWRVSIESNPRSWDAVAGTESSPLALAEDLLPHAFDVARNVFRADLEGGWKTEIDEARPALTFSNGTGRIEIAYGTRWHESAEAETANGMVRMEPQPALLSLWRKLTRQDNEPVVAAASLLESFAEDIRAGAYSDDLIHWARFRERVLLPATRPT